MRIRKILATSALLLACAAAAVARPADAEPAATMKAGKELFEKSCKLCHGLDRTLALTQDAPGWVKIVKRMVAYGAPLNAEQRPAVVRYLATRSLFAGKCGSCHEATRVVSDTPGPRDWKALTGRMAEHVRDLQLKGQAPAAAVFSPGELEDIAAFLQVLLP